MPGYRCYFLDGESHIRGVEQFAAADDDKAIAKAQRLFDGLQRHAGFEVWHGARRVTSGRREDPDRAMERALPWSESFGVGHERLDAEHRHLVEIINDIDGAVRRKRRPEQIAHLQKVLRQATAEHIEHENTLLSEIRSGTYKPMQDRSRAPPHFLKVMPEATFEHIADHGTLLARLDAIIAGSRDALCEALKTWFLDHMIKHDSYLRAIFQAM